MATHSASNFFEYNVNQNVSLNELKPGKGADIWWVMGLIDLISASKEEEEEEDGAEHRHRRRRQVFRRWILGPRSGVNLSKLFPAVIYDFSQ